MRSRGTGAGVWDHRTTWAAKLVPKAGPGLATCALTAPRPSLVVCDIRVAPSVGSFTGPSGSPGPAGRGGTFRNGPCILRKAPPPTAKQLNSKGWNFKLTQIFQCFSSMFQIDIYVG